jgi:hypothetical protein
MVVLHAACSNGVAQNSPPTLIPYQELVKEADQRLADGDLSGALQFYQRAANLDLFELPNYKVLVKVAEVQCRQRNTVVGNSNLKDFRCMLDVDAGRLPCFLPSNDVQPKLNPAVGGECFKRMCGEIYLGYYENPTSSQLQAVKRLTKEADRVSKMCSSDGH